MVSHQFHLTLTQALLESLDLRRILYVLLTGITAGDGLNFNRAFLLLADEGRRVLQGEFAIGPSDSAEAYRIWLDMAAQEFTLPRVMAQFDAWEEDTRAASLSREFQRVSIPVPTEAGAMLEHPFFQYVGRSFSGRQAAVVNDLTLAVPGTSLTLRQFAVAPLHINDRAIGVLLVDNFYNGRRIDRRELDDLATLANLAAIAVERARLHERVRRLAEQDGLTGLLNRRKLDEVLPQRIRDSRAHGVPLSLILLDVDHFKAVNDSHGHVAGDDLLRGVASVIRQRLRLTDVACRFGGDEFAVLLPRTDGPEALQLAEHLRSAIADSGSGDPAGQRSASVSIGVAVCRDDHSDASALLREADAALYAAKLDGRNRAVLFHRHRGDPYSGPLPQAGPQYRRTLRSALSRWAPKGWCTSRR